MPEQFENPNEAKLEVETANDLTAKQRIDRVADKLAAKPAKVEQKFDKENSNLFTK